MVVQAEPSDVALGTGTDARAAVIALPRAPGWSAWHGVLVRVHEEWVLNGKTSLNPVV